MHRIGLFYGYQRSSETYDTYHAFETVDIYDDVDVNDMAAKLAGMLDCSPEDDDFNWNSMAIALPDKTVERIKMEGRMEAMLSAWDGMWRNDACKGYAIMAMERAGFDADTIRKVSAAMTDCFDDTSVDAAGRYYEKGAIV